MESLIEALLISLITLIYVEQGLCLSFRFHDTYPAILFEGEQEFFVRGKEQILGKEVAALYVTVQVVK